MHANSTQIQVQIPAAYYSLGSVALSGSLGFGSGHHSIEHSPTSPTSSATTPLHPYHPGTNTLSSQYHSSQHHHHSPTQQSGYHSQQQQHYSNGNAYHPDMQKTIPMQHQVDIYQPPHQTFDSDLMNPTVNRQLNHQHASNYHSPYNYNQHYPSSYHYNTSSKQQQPQQIEQQQADQQPRSNTSTPTPTLASNLSTVSSASTPLLSSNTITLQGNRQASPASSCATTSSGFHVPASPDQLTPLVVNMTQDMSNWAANDVSSLNQELQASLSPVAREHLPLSGNSSPRNNDRSLYFPQQTASHLYSSQQEHQHQQAQAWVASMSADNFHASQEILEQGRQHHHQRSYSQSSRYGHSQQPSVASQPAIGGLPLLSPSSMLPSDYQASSYSVNMHNTPTIMSHLDYSRVASSTSISGGARYNPIRGTHKKSRTHSLGSQHDFARTRTNSTSSVASSGILSSLTASIGSASIGLSTTHEMEEEDEDSDSPTTILMRPRANTAPRKAVAARVFECSVPGCTKAYTQLHNLKSHERTGHTPVIKLKPFHCIIEGCAKAFSQRKSLALHIKTAHADYKFKPFKCSQSGCQKAYTQLHNLRTHEKTVHLVDLSRKRVKNPSQSSVGNMGISTSSGNQMGYHYPGLGLGYDGLSDLEDLGSHGDDHDYYQRQHDQQQHHHQQYARISHMNAMSSIYDRS